MVSPRTPSPPAPAREADASRRSVVPQAAGRSLWFAAVWTGVGATVAAAVVAIVAAAVCWIPASGPSGHASSAIHAGLLSLLAALHAGVTVDGTATAFVPLGLTLLAGTITWRAGSGLADAADELDETDPRRLVAAGLLQVLAFTVCCLIAVPFATLGTSSAPVVGVAVGALVLCAVTAGTALVRSSALRDVVEPLFAPAVRVVLRVALGTVIVYLAAGALLAAGSLVAHHDRVEALSRAVGGGWSGVPLLVLGVLAAPNAAIGGASYLAGPGVAVGQATASPFATAHGVVPAFPLLGALPDGDGASALTWWLIIATLLWSGVAAARAVMVVPGWVERVRLLALGAAGAAVAGALLAWFGGGGIGDGPLSTVGASPWQFGGALALVVLGAGGLVLGLARAWSWLDTGEGSLFADLLGDRDGDRDDDRDGDRDDGRREGRPGSRGASDRGARAEPARTPPATVARAARARPGRDAVAAATDDDPDRPAEAAG